MWKIGTVRGYNRGWTSDIYTKKTPEFRRLKYSFNKRSLRLFLLYPWKNEKFNQNIIHWTITLITPLFGIVHFKTNYNYRLSNHCFINELILVTYALISNAVEKKEDSHPWNGRSRKLLIAFIEIFICHLRMCNLQISSKYDTCFSVHSATANHRWHFGAIKRNGWVLNILLGSAGINTRNTETYSYPSEILRETMITTSIIDISTKKDSQSE